MSTTYTREATVQVGSLQLAYRGRARDVSRPVAHVHSQHQLAHQLGYVQLVQCDASLRNEWEKRESTGIRAETGNEWQIKEVSVYQYIISKCRAAEFYRLTYLSTLANSRFQQYDCQWRSWRSPGLDTAQSCGTNSYGYEEEREDEVMLMKRKGWCRRLLVQDPQKDSEDAITRAYP